MTRLAVLADIHSNLPALEAVLDDLSHFTVDKIIVAGDVVNWGAFSSQVMERLAALDCAIIRGNNELYLTEWQTPRMPESWKIFTLPPYTIAQLGDRWMNVISAWPASFTQWLFEKLRPIQNGFVRSYALSVLVGVVVIIGYLLLK